MANNTSIFTKNGMTHYVFYGVPVVVFNDVAIILNTENHFTKTTKHRINQASKEYDLGFKVIQKNKEWLVDYKGKLLSFVDGMTLER